MNTHVNLWKCLVEFFSQYEFIQTNNVEKVKIYILCSVIYIYFFLKWLFLWDREIKYGEAGRAIDDNVAHAHCMARNTHSEYVIITALQQHLG